MIWRWLSWTSNTALGWHSGALCGAINGFFVARVGMSPLIATLGMMLAARGLVFSAYENRTIRVEAGITWRKIIEAMAEGVFTLDREGIIGWVDPGRDHDPDWTPDGLIGRSVFSVLEDYPALLDQVCLALSGTAAEGELRRGDDPPPDHHRGPHRGRGNGDHGDDHGLHQAHPAVGVAVAAARRQGAVGDGHQG